MIAWLEDPVLDVTHGFGVRGAPAPAGLTRPRQVHGTRIHDARVAGDAAGVEADAIASRRPGLPIGVVTADCVPVLLADASGALVAAVHAGWRGLAAGVVAGAVGHLQELGASALAAAIGPHVGPCCYEVDEPVLGSLRRRFGGEALGRAVRAGRPGHAWLDLGSLVAEELRRAGLAGGRIGTATAACTACDSERFHSYRRDGPRAGRLLHWVVAGGSALDTPPG